MTVILACNIPLIAAFYPGIVAWDCEYELEMALGCIPASTHHPPFHMLLLGFLWRIGGENGLFFLVVIQFVLYAYAVARTAETSIQLGLRKTIALAFVAFAAVFPFAISRELSLYKDALFLSFAMLLACDIVRISFGLHEKQKNPKCERALLCTRTVVLAIFVTTLRNDGIFIVVVFMTLSAFLSKNTRCIAIVSATTSLTLSLMLTAIVWPALGIAPGSKGEALSLPIQQIARIFNLHEEAPENDAFPGIDKAMNAQAAGDAYNPYFADPAKGAWRNVDGAAEGFLKSWVSYGIQYPADFAEAAWSMWAGYLAPWPANLNGHEEDTFQLTHRSDYDESAAVVVNSPEVSAPLRSLYTLYCKAWTKVPIFSIFSNPGIYTWILAISLSCLLRGKKKGAGKNLLALAMQFLVLGICLLSPVAACMRYYLPAAMMTPLALGSVANIKQESCNKA